MTTWWRRVRWSYLPQAVEVERETAHTLVLKSGRRQHKRAPGHVFHQTEQEALEAIIEGRTRESAGLRERADQIDRKLAATRARLDAVQAEQP